MSRSHGRAARREPPRRPRDASDGRVFVPAEGPDPGEHRLRRRVRWRTPHAHRGHHRWQDLHVRSVRARGRGPGRREAGRQGPLPEHQQEGHRSRRRRAGRGGRRREGHPVRRHGDGCPGVRRDEQHGRVFQGRARGRVFAAVRRSAGLACSRIVRRAVRGFAASGRRELLASGPGRVRRGGVLDRRVRRRRGVGRLRGWEDRRRHGGRRRARLRGRRRRVGARRVRGQGGGRRDAPRAGDGKSSRTAFGFVRSSRNRNRCKSLCVRVARRRGGRARRRDVPLAREARHFETRDVCGGVRLDR